MKRSWMVLVGLLALQSVAHALPVPVWDKVITSGRRFRVLSAFGNAAVRDNETGLVWMRDTTVIAPTVYWSQANLECLILTFANRRGWRLPTVEELSTLIDSSQVPLELPAGHPFTVSGIPTFWSSTTVHDSPARAFTVGLGGSIGSTSKTDAFVRRVWCVRGGHGHDGQ